MKVKSKITIVDQIRAIETIVSYCFTDGQYTPYYMEMGKLEAIVENFIVGCTINENEYVYELMGKHKDLNDLVMKFLTKSDDGEESDYVKIMNFVMNNVYEIVEFKKQKLIRSTENLDIACTTLVEFISDLDKALGNLRNLDLSQLTPEVIDTGLNIMNQLKDKDINADVLTDVIKNAVDFKVPETEIYEGQREQIGRLQDLLKEERDKNKELADKIVKFEKK